MSEEKEIMSKKETDPLAKINETGRDVQKSVSSRVRTRIKEIEVLVKAKHEKINKGYKPNIYTTPPRVHATPIMSSMSNGVATIEYGVYKGDGKGNKFINEVKGINPTTGAEYVSSMNYILEYNVIETIEPKRPIKREVFNYEEERASSQ